MQELELQIKKYGRCSEAGDALRVGYEAVSLSSVLNVLYPHGSSRGSLHTRLKPTHEVRDDDKNICMS